MTIYTWYGNWVGSGAGFYVITQDGREMEPSEIIEALERLDDMKEQVSHLTGRVPTPESIREKIKGGTL